MYTVDGLFPTQRRIRDQVISYLVLVLALASLIAEIYKIINADEVVNKTKKASKQMMEELVAHQQKVVDKLEDEIHELQL